MSIVKALFDQSVISTDECFGQPDVTSQEMRDAINAWRDTYLKREGDKASDPCMRMAYVIVHKLQKHPILIGVSLRFAGYFRQGENGQGKMDGPEPVAARPHPGQHPAVDADRRGMLGKACTTARPRWQHDLCPTARTQDRRRDPGA